MKTKLIIIIVVLVAVITGLGVYGWSIQPKEEEVVEATPEPTDTPTPTQSATPTPTPSPTPSATPTPTPSATPTPSPTATPEPTPTPTPLPVLEFKTDKTEAESINGAEVCVALSGPEGVSYEAKITEGDGSTWLEPGFLFIYPKSDVKVRIMGSLKDHQNSSVEVSVKYVVKEVPTPTPASGGGKTPDPNEDLSFFFRGSMEGLKGTFFDAASANGVDPYLVIAIACHETGYGSSEISKTYNNFGGVMNKDYTDFRYFDTPRDGVYYLAGLIRWYKDNGKSTIPEICEWYCNGEQHWTDRVTTIYNALTQ
ncbi:MAG: glucosaminidase domain-containing protein [Erysipelotrichaceae bacterium]|nr:glucosaminidase domain-containing protein [Erysipelotrichaceae bacterium]